MNTVYLLWHQFELKNNESEEIEDRAKLIGVYFDEEEAKRAINRVSDQPGFRDYPEGFLIEAHKLGQDNWTEGFVTNKY